MINQINYYLYKLTRIIYKTYKNFKRLKSLQKLFLLFLVLTFLFIIVNNFGNSVKPYNYEGFDNDKLNILDESNYFEIKRDMSMYDDFYSNYYDSIHLNQKKNNYEIGKVIGLEKKNKFTKILDVGCGTGNHVELLNKKSYDVIGIDKSKSMIKKANTNYPKCEFVKGDFLKGDVLDYNSFSHIMCLGRTIYLMKDKDKFFENCHTLLMDNGLLIVNLVNKDKFNPYIINNTTVLFDSNNYGKQPKQHIVKFSNDFEYVSDYVINEQHNDNKNPNIPYATYKEKFENFKTHSVRKNELNMYMLSIDEIVSKALAKGFELKEKINMKDGGFANDFLYVFKK